MRLMARSDGRIEQGQSIRNAISAKAWNRAQDAADMFLGSESTSVTASQGFQQLPYSWVYVKMLVDVEVGDCVKLLSFYVEAPLTETLEESVRLRPVPVLYGTATKTGQASEHSEKQSGFGIAVEPIKKDAVGRVAVAGVVACNVFCNKSWHSYAAQKNGESILESSPFGNIQILCWHTATNEFTQTENINSVRTALVRLGNTTPCQLVVINFDAPGGIWKRYTTQNVVLPSGSSGVYKTGRKTGWSQQPASIGFPPNYLVVRNVLADIRQSGQGVVAPWGDEWLLINWSPASFTVEQRTGESKEIAVPTYTTPGTPPTLQQP